MVRSRLFGAVSLVTAISVGVSSAASAGPMLPAVSTSAANGPSIQKVDQWRDKREQKRIEWQRHDGDRRGPDRDGRGPDRDYRGPEQSYRGPGPDHGGRGGPPQRTVVIVKPVPPGPRLVVPPQRRYFYRNVWVVRPYGHWYPGYGYYYHDNDAYRWLAFTAITLSALSLLTVAQERAHEQAQIDATTAPVGSTIVWNDANASGSVTVTRDGRSTDGQYCREYQQAVTVGGQSQQAYGTACMQPDGAWRIVNTQ
jgi:hypothetical protein